MNSRIILCLLAVLPLWAATERTRLKDLVSIEGVRDNQLVGYGIVVGLNRTGDSQQTIFSAQSLTNLLAAHGCGSLAYGSSRYGTRRPLS